jgi:hypothetical protein
VGHLLRQRIGQFSRHLSRGFSGSGVNGVYQRNRVRIFFSDEACEKVIVPRGDLAPQAHGVLAGEGAGLPAADRRHRPRP